MLFNGQNKLIDQKQHYARGGTGELYSVTTRNKSCIQLGFAYKSSLDQCNGSLSLGRIPQPCRKEEYNSGINLWEIILR